MCVAAAHIDVSGVVPTLCRVFEQVDGAYWTEERIVGIGDRHRRRQHCSGNELHALELPARLDRAGSGLRVVDEVRTLQVPATGADKDATKGNMHRYDDELRPGHILQVMEYLQDPGQLTAILQRLDNIRRAVYQHTSNSAFQATPAFTCGAGPLARDS